MHTTFDSELLCIDLQTELHLAGVETSTPVTVTSKHINAHIHIQKTAAGVVCRGLQVLFRPRVVQEYAIAVIKESSGNIKHQVSCTSRLAFDF
jgi:hypothetical protein